MQEDGIQELYGGDVLKEEAPINHIVSNRWISIIPILWKGWTVPIDRDKNREVSEETPAITRRDESSRQICSGRA
jgi:hypothetical protein